ncbi:MAG TPA: hypothetical protein VLR72_05375 [Clostridiaceae bacterium]|nr:hypothetical protein [Clostridiaceae bacterium]
MKTKMSKSSILFFVAAAFVAAVGTALLINNILLYNENVTMYVSQGYSMDTVAAQLLPAQLIPGVLEPIGAMYGIAFVLVAAGVLNNKLSKVLALTSATSASMLPETVTEAEAEAEVEEAKETVYAEAEADAEISEKEAVEKESEIKGI